MVDQPGQEAVLDRLLDLLLIAVLRAWFARPEAEAPGWYRAHADPVVGPALRLLHNAPEHPWTLAELAAACGASRAALARRFSELVGEPPMAFLTGWRIALAADLLLEPGATVGSVAPQVGYGSPYALSTAFKRVRGIEPRGVSNPGRSGLSPAAMPGGQPVPPSAGAGGLAPTRRRRRLTAPACRRERPPTTFTANLSSRAIRRSGRRWWRRPCGGCR